MVKADRDGRRVKMGDGLMYASEVVVVGNTTRSQNNDRLLDPKLFPCSCDDDGESPH